MGIIYVTNTNRGKLTVIVFKCEFERERENLNLLTNRIIQCSYLRKNSYFEKDIIFFSK